MNEFLDNLNGNSGFVPSAIINSMMEVEKHYRPSNKNLGSDSNYFKTASLINVIENNTENKSLAKSFVKKLKK